MEPTISGGSLVIAKLASPDYIEDGDIIAVPGSGDVPILHRVISVVRYGERVAVITKGDNNGHYDSGFMTLNGPVRRVVLVLQVGPWAGVALAWCGLVSSSLLGLWVTRPRGSPTANTGIKKPRLQDQGTIWLARLAKAWGRPPVLRVRAAAKRD